MNQAEQERHQIQRILVALDSSSASLAALKQAVKLAANFEAELLGLYVEDINLVRLAEISFTQEVGLFSASRRRLEIRYVERQFRGQASRARQAMARLADLAEVPWTFKVVRGVVAKEVLNAASEADLIVLGRVGLSGPVRRRIGSTARAVLLQSSQLTLVLHPDIQMGLPMMAIYDGSPIAQKGLIAAAQLSQSQDEPLLVLIIADNLEAARQLERQAEEKLQGLGLSAEYLFHRQGDPQRLVSTIQAQECRMLVVPSDGAELSGGAILSVLENIHCPVLLVR